MQNVTCNGGQLGRDQPAKYPSHIRGHKSHRLKSCVGLCTKCCVLLHITKLCDCCVLLLLAAVHRFPLSSACGQT